MRVTHQIICVTLPMHWNTKRRCLGVHMYHLEQNHMGYLGGQPLSIGSTGLYIPHLLWNRPLREAGVGGSNPLTPTN